MAFSKQPNQNTYTTKQINLMKEYTSRAGGFSKDPDYLNVFFEVTKNRTTQENSYDVFVRPGTGSWSAPLQSTNVRQVYYWEAQQRYYVWVDDDIQVIDNTGSIITTVAAALGTSNGVVGVCEFQYDTGQVVLVFTDGTDLKTIDASHTVTASVSPDKPASILTTMVYLDGYLFVVKSGTSDIYNSNLNDPLAFTAGDFITAEILPDTITSLSRMNNYLLAFGGDSVEYFWDAANATGSPLQRNDTPVKLNGFMTGLATFGNKVFFIGNPNEGAPALFVLEDFKIKEIGNESLRRQLENIQSPYVSWSPVICSINGHNFYILTASTYTFVIDIETGLWSRWAYKASGRFNISFCGNGKTSIYNPVFYISGEQQLSKFDASVATDSLTSFTMTIVTGLEDFESYNQKVINRLTVYGDRPSATTTLSISWTDDDYQTFSTPQTVNLNQELPCIYQCGSFRRRAHKITCTPVVPFRIRYLEADINLGNT